MISPRTGRPPEPHPKDFLLQVRLDKDTLALLDENVKRLGTTRSQVVREGIRLVAEQTDK